jgi:hypothetical protein
MDQRTLRQDRAALKAAASAVLGGVQAQARADVPQDVFFWDDGAGRHAALVPWSACDCRAASIVKDGHAWVNATPLPNGIPAGQAILAGIILRNATADWHFGAHK